MARGVYSLGTTLMQQLSLSFPFLIKKKYRAIHAIQGKSQYIPYWYVVSFWRGIHLPYRSLLLFWCEDEMVSSTAI
jgi:hypothetical protein